MALAASGVSRGGCNATAGSFMQLYWSEDQCRKSVHGMGGGDNPGIFAVFSKIPTLRGMDLI